MTMGETLGQVYSRQPDKVRELIENDPDGEDVAAVTSRRKAVTVFEEMMQDDSLTESAWQDFLKTILGFWEQVLACRFLQRGIQTN